MAKEYYDARVKELADSGLDDEALELLLIARFLRLEIDTVTAERDRLRQEVERLQTRCESLQDELQYGE